MKYLLPNQTNLLTDNDYCQTKFYKTLKFELLAVQIVLFFLFASRKILILFLSTKKYK